MTTYLLIWICLSLAVAGWFSSLTTLRKLQDAEDELREARHRNYKLRVARIKYGSVIMPHRRHQYRYDWSLGRRTEVMEMVVRDLQDPDLPLDVNGAMAISDAVRWIENNSAILEKTS